MYVHIYAQARVMAMLTRVNISPYSYNDLL